MAAINRAARTVCKNIAQHCRSRSPSAAPLLRPRPAEYDNHAEYPCHSQPLPPISAGSRSHYCKSRWVFMGGPGVGKGTYATRLSNALGVPHISMGDLIREELIHHSESPATKDIVSQGRLLPNDVVFGLLAKRLEKNGEQGFILDGFPRTKSQAESLENVAKIDQAINLKLGEDELLKRCLGRRICSECGKCFSVASDDSSLRPPARCASKMTTRPDDTEDVIKERFRIYNQMSKPVEDFYGCRGKFAEIKLDGGLYDGLHQIFSAMVHNQLDDNNNLEIG